MIGRPRVALVGAGEIAPFHVDALLHAGFDLAAVAATTGSSRARELAARYGARWATDVDELCADSEWDAVVVAAPVEPTLEILASVVAVGKPVLVEKPVALRSRDLEPFLDPALPVIVGYNRRFYEPVLVARRMAAGGPPLIAHLSLPDMMPPDDDPTSLLYFFLNSVHGLDLTLFVLGDLEVVSSARLATPKGLGGIAAILRTARGDVLTFSGAWGTPANFGLALDRPGHRFLLQPFELGTEFTGMEVVEPTPEMPIRRFLPQLSKTVLPAAEDLEHKPGFVGQARALADLCAGREPGIAARLTDAHRVLVLAEELAGTTMP